ncbi:MAG: winged helix-turn-helix transcriptional regulator [Sphingomonadales bacterium]|nr:winged helix-turn-helix transcriptional regulator [Sphingomonadales bacterium]
MSKSNGTKAKTGRRPAKAAAAPVRADGGPGGSQVSLGRLGDFVGFRLRRVQNHLSRHFATATAAEGLRSGLFSSLALIEANPGISQIALSREVGQDKSVAVAIVDDLEKLGWAERRRSTTDRRRHALYVTAAGQAKLDALFAVVDETESAVLHQLSPGEKQLLSELLDRMYAAIAGGES